VRLRARQAAELRCRSDQLKAEEMRGRKVLEANAAIQYDHILQESVSNHLLQMRLGVPSLVTQSAVDKCCGPEIWLDFRQTKVVDTPLYLAGPRLNIPGLDRLEAEERRTRNVLEANTTIACHCHRLQMRLGLPCPVAQCDTPIYIPNFRLKNNMRPGDDNKIGDGPLRLCTMCQKRKDFPRNRKFCHACRRSAERSATPTPAAVVSQVPCSSTEPRAKKRMTCASQYDRPFLLRGLVANYSYEASNTDQYVGRTGIKNVNHTCFLSSLMQSLSALLELEVALQ